MMQEKRHDDVYIWKRCSSISTRKIK